MAVHATVAVCVLAPFHEMGSEATLTGELLASDTMRPLVKLTGEVTSGAPLDAEHFPAGSEARNIMELPVRFTAATHGPYTLTLRLDGGVATTLEYYVVPW